MKYIVFGLFVLLVSGCADNASIVALSNRIDNLHINIIKTADAVNINKREILRLTNVNKKNNQALQGILVRLKNEESATAELKKLSNSPKLPNFRIIPVSHLKFDVKRKKIAKPVDKTAIYKNAFNLFKKDRYAGSIMLFKKFISKNPKSKLADNAQFWIAQNFLQQGKIKKSVKSLNVLLESYKKLPENRGGKADIALYQLYKIYVKLNNTKKALDSLKELVTIFPKSKYSKKLVKSLLGGRR